MTAQSGEMTIGEALDLGTQYAIAGNHKSACSIFRGVMLHEPENFEAIERLGTVLDLYKLDVGGYPTTEQGLDALLATVEALEVLHNPA